MSTGAQMLLDRVRAATEDEYTIERELGRGGMAAVYLARDIRLTRRVAIKVMLPDLVDVEGIAERFVIEAQTAAHLDHPGIVTVYSVKERAGLLFIVMKYIEGRTLEEVLETATALDPQVAMTIVSQVAEALQFAHTEGVIHRDVKPSNILIDTRGRPVVTDFGIAKIASGRSLTVTGAMIGTPAYMSPEQCRGLPATAASDQYSLGVMTYEMLARRLPFEGTLFELIHAHSDTPPAPLRELVPGIDAELEETVLKMLAKKPGDRWPTMGDAAKRLTPAQAQHRRPSEVQATIAALARLPNAPPPPKRTAGFADISGAATEVATTPAPALVITPDEPSIEIGESVQLKLSESSGASLGGIRIRWRTEDPSVAEVDENGVVTGKSVGLAKITASGGMAFGRMAVTVKAAHVDTLVVTPQSREIETDNELQLVATALDARGTPVVGQTIIWTSSDVNICAVSQTGRAIGMNPGRAEIVANCGAVRGSAQIKVRAPAVERVVVHPVDPNIEVEEQVRLSATLVGPLERTLTGRPVMWRSSAPMVVTVTKDGVIEGVSPGTAAVFAKCEGKEGLASVSVRPQPVVAVRIQPAQLKLEVGRSLQLQGIGEDRKGRPVAGGGLDWHSDDDRIALVDASGKVHAVREGNTVVRATNGEVTSAIEVTVVPRPAAQIRIEAHPPELRVGKFVTLDAAVLDADGGVLAGRNVTWASSDPKVVSVSAEGACEAKRPGSVRITAACERARATTKVSVAAAAPVGGVAPTGGGSATFEPGDEPPTVVIERASIFPPPKPAQAAPAPAQPAPAPPAPAARGAPARSGNRFAMIGGAAGILLAVVIGAVIVKGGGDTPTTGETPVFGGPPASIVGTTGPTGSTTAIGNTGDTGRGGGGRQVVGGQDTGGRGTPPTGATGRTGTPPPVVVPPRIDSTDIRRRVADSIADAGAARRRAADSAAAEQRRRAADSAAAEQRRRAADAAAATRRLLCENNAGAEQALRQAFGESPAGPLGTLYVPRGAADTRFKNDLLGALRDVQQLRAAVRAVRNEPAGDACDWVMAVEFSFTNFVGNRRTRNVELRMRLEPAASGVRVGQLFQGRNP